MAKLGIPTASSVGELTARDRRYRFTPEEVMSKGKGVMCSAVQFRPVSLRVNKAVQTARSGVTVAGSKEWDDSHSSLDGLILKSKRLPTVSANFDLFDPKVLDAVDAATMLFCRDTNETATRDLDNALKALRRSLKLGLKRGNAVELLARNIKRIFADPARAYRIATTEASRAVHAGALYNAKESGVVKKKRWLASLRACQFCKDLDGKTVKLDKPFIVLPSGGPYATIMTPPGHPHCECDFTEIL